MEFLEIEKLFYPSGNESKIIMTCVAREAFRVLIPQEMRSLLS